MRLKKRMMKIAGVGEYINEQGEMIPIDHKYPNSFPYEEYKAREDGTMIKMTEEERLEKNKNEMEFRDNNYERFKIAEKNAWYVVNQELSHRTDVTYQDKEDLVSEVLRSVIKNMDTYNDQKSKFSTWVETITKNKIIDFINKLERIQAKYPGFSHFEEFDDDTFIDEQHQPKEIEKQEKLIQIEEAIEKLPEKEKMFIEDRFYNEKTFDQLKEEYGMTYSQTKSYYDKIIKKLKQMV